MPSEYEIYRAYAGLNRPQSKLDYFLQGVGKLQGIAESNKRLELQERRLEQDDERANERLELAQTQEERMREQYEDNKNKYEEESFNKRNEQSWKSIVEFSKGMQLGQRHPFLEKMATKVLDDDWMQKTGAYDMMETFKESEKEELAMNDRYSIAKNEDSADKVKKFREFYKDSLSNTQNQLLITKENNMRKAHADQKPFDINKLSMDEQRKYKFRNKQIDGILDKIATAEAQGGEFAEKNLPALRKQYNDALAEIQPYEVKGAPTPLPAFTASSESLTAIGADPELRSRFFATEDNDLDAFLLAQNGGVGGVVEEEVPEEVPEEVDVDEEVVVEPSILRKQFDRNIGQWADLQAKESDPNRILNSQEKGLFASLDKQMRIFLEKMDEDERKIVMDSLGEEQLKALDWGAWVDKYAKKKTV